MKNLFALIIAFVCCISCALAETAYSPAENIYNNSTDATAQEFADQMVETAEGIYQQTGVKSVIYLFDSFGAEEQEDFLSALIEERKASVGELSNEVVFIIAVQDEEYLIWASDDLKQVLTDEVIEAVRAGVESTENETFWQEVVKAYTGVVFRMAFATQQPGQ